MAAEIHVGDLGTVFTITVTKEDGTIPDLSGLIEKKILFQKPDGSAKEVNASFTTNGSDGKIKYSTVAGDLDQPGNWKIQGFVKFNSTQGWYTNIEKFKVFANVG